MEELLREVLSGSRMLHFEGTKKDEAPLVEAAGRDAGYVEDEGALYEKMTVRKYLKFFAGLSGTEKRVRSAVEQMHLSELLGKRLFHLAGVTALLPWGFLTGVYAKDQNSVNVYAAVSVVAVYVAPVFSYWNVAFGRLAEFLPTGILGVVLKKLQPMEGFMDVSLVWGGAVCAVWFLAGIASLFVIRKKRPFFPNVI